MTILRLIIYLFFALPLNSWSQDEKTPTFDIDDLLSLYNAKEIDEFLSKAKEIRPAIRGPRWRAMVTEFTKIKIDKLANTPLVAINFDEIVKAEEYATFGHHLNDLDLQNKKLDLGLKYLTYSLKEINKWDETKVKDLKKWWYKHWLNSNKQPIYAYRYAQLFDSYSPLNKFESVNLTIFFDNQDFLNQMLKELLHLTYKSGLSLSLCKDPWVWNYLWQDLKIFIGKMKKSDQADFDSKIVKEYSLNCWNAAKSKLFADFHLFPEEDIHFALHLLSMDRTLSFQQRSFIHIFYLLFEPTSSDLYINALDTLLKLSLSEKNRLDILTLLAKIDPLEGKIFSSSSSQALEVLLRMSRSFPEYLDYYAQTCYDYLAGIKKFPLGNPTPDCLAFCRSYRLQKIPFFSKPVYTNIKEKFRGQCDKPASNL